MIFRTCAWRDHRRVTMISGRMCQQSRLADIGWRTTDDARYGSKRHRRLGDGDHENRQGRDGEGSV
jgi:hypothetical protein